MLFAPALGDYDVLIRLDRKACARMYGSRNRAGKVALRLRRGVAAADDPEAQAQLLGAEWKSRFSTIVDVLSVRTSGCLDTCMSSGDMPAREDVLGRRRKGEDKGLSVPREVLMGTLAYVNSSRENS